MPNPTWPASLPQQQFEGLEESQIPAFVDFQVGAGPDKRRLIATRGRKIQRTPIELNGTQLATFNTFFEDTLSWGSSVFDWTSGDFITDTTRTFRIVEVPKWRLSKPGSTVASRHYTGELVLEVIA